MTEIRDVIGYCPMGCGRTLHLMPGGMICCLDDDCPDLTAVTQILADAETEHVVEFRRYDFTVRHPLRERVEDALMTCDLHPYLVGLEPLQSPGRYRVRLVDDELTMEALDG